MGKNHVLFCLFVFNQIRDCFWAEIPLQIQQGNPCRKCQGLWYGESQGMPAGHTGNRSSHTWTLEWLMFPSASRSWKSIAQLNRCVIIHDSTLSLNILCIQKPNIFTFLVYFQMQNVYSRFVKVLISLHVLSKLLSLIGFNRWTSPVIIVMLDIVTVVPWSAL